MLSLGGERPDISFRRVKFPTSFRHHREGRVLHDGEDGNNSRIAKNAPPSEAQGIIKWQDRSPARSALPRLCTSGMEFNCEFVSLLMSQCPTGSVAVRCFCHADRSRCLLVNDSTLRALYSTRLHALLHDALYGSRSLRPRVSTENIKRICASTLSLEHRPTSECDEQVVPLTDDRDSTCLFTHLLHRLCTLIVLIYLASRPPIWPHDPTRKPH